MAETRSMVEDVIRVAQTLCRSKSAALNMVNVHFV